MKNYFKSLSAEQPDVRFFGLRLVKFVSVIFGSVFFFTLTVTVLDTSTLNWKLDVEGLKFFFLDAMKVPGSILAFYLAVLGLIGANHRSEQTKNQIEEARVQNDFANYYKHKEEFLKYVDGISQSQYLHASRMVRMHSWLFPESRRRDFKVNPDCVLKLDHHISSFAGYILGLVDESAHKSALDSLSNLNGKIQADFGLKYMYTNAVKSSKSDDKPWSNASNSLNGFLGQFVRMFKCIDILFQFDPDYKPSAKMGYLLDFAATWPKVDTLDFNDLEASQVETYKQIASKILQS
ncbi:hypothetical protein NB618_02295 [Vibrio antiquarius]|uniref:hypothetical protein n=1 Tax=Vibrio TaxID=662 RepID=UPI002657FB03|nr:MULTISPECIES: hypothetical protein [Vibrio]MCR9935266.1 hypothetical protein [Vibrio antiquarius]MDW1799218.1 hypothetical protein [Vibrio sp. Vb2201]